MKKIFLVATIALMMTVISNAQSLRPRFGIVPSEDNTYRALQISYNTVKDATGTKDTIRLYPNSYLNYVQNTMTDSCVYVIRSSSNAYFGDRVRIHVTNKKTVEHHLYISSATTNSQIIFQVGAADSVNTVAAEKSLIAEFEFNGSKWVETLMIK